MPCQTQLNISHLLVSLCLFALYSSIGTAETVRRQGNFDVVKREVEKILSPSKQRALRVGIYAASVKKGDTIYERTPDRQLIPASVSKIFTAYAAMKKLGSTASFATEVYRTGVLKDGRLTGDLYLKGGGDPSLVSERMWMLVNELVRSGIRKITGRLVADSSFYDSVRRPKARPQYLKDQAYNAPIGALSFNFNTTTIYVNPGDSPGQKPVVYTDPENSYIDIVNQATTGKPGSKNSIRVKRTSFVKGDIGDTVLLRGSLPVNHRELRFYRNIVNPALYTAHMFKTFWERRGLKLKGVVVEGRVPKSAKRILAFESLPLWQIIWGLNKFSNNFVADQIMKKVGAEAWGAPGTMKKGILAMSDALGDIGIRKGSYQIFDGSGLNRKTRVTARQVVQVLRSAHNDFTIAPEFVASLGIAGEDGTLRRRLPTSKTRGKLRGKTGSLDGVASLAGIVPAQNGELIAFAIILNDRGLKYGRMTGWVDQVAVALSKFTR